MCHRRGTRVADSETEQTDRDPRPGEASDSGGLVRTPVRALKAAYALLV